MIQQLPEIRSLSGHDAYCHVCWYPFYSLWVDKEPPPNTCVEGRSKMTDCRQAMSRARMAAHLAKERAEIALDERSAATPQTASQGNGTTP